MTNPLLESFSTPFETAPFGQIKTEHFLPAIELLMAQTKAEFDRIKNNPQAATFENTILAFDAASEKLDRAAEIFSNLLGAEGPEEMHELAQKISPMLAKFSSDYILDEKIFQRIQSLYNNRSSQTYNKEQLRILEKSYKAFVRNGAQADASTKEKIRSIDQELSQLAPKFSQNILKSSNAFEYWISKEEDLKGLPDTAKEAAKSAAKEKNRPNDWLLTLDAPSYLPAMTYCSNRKIREDLARAYGMRANAGEFDNKSILIKIAQLRLERAKLLGFKTHADYVLEERMAGSVERVQAFLSRIIQIAKPVALKELEEVANFAKTTDNLQDFKSWDWPYYSEKLKQNKFQFDEEELRPYFKLENVIDGVFLHAKKLYNLEFIPRADIPVYHPDVKTYEVRDSQSGQFMAVFYADFFPRPTKRNGAWMTSFKEQGSVGGKMHRPHISIVCNFTKPTESKPSLISFGEVETLFHEFGHALHGMLSNCQYRSVSGTNVYWDFVELPSQIMENWVHEKESLDLFAMHYKTGEKIPQALAEKIKKSGQFLAASSAIRQLHFATLDMAWHSAQDLSQVQDVNSFEIAATKQTQLLPRIDGTLISTGFSHIFAGGYSAGYYSYKWAEVLDADAFELFKEKGLFNAEVAKSFRENILSQGGTEHPLELYKKFRGREPDPDALLRRDGLL